MSIIMFLFVNKSIIDFLNYPGLSKSKSAVALGGVGGLLFKNKITANVSTPPIAA